MPVSLQYLLLQVRNPEDAMREHERRCFSSALGCPLENIHVYDLLSGCPGRAEIDAVDVVVLGGSGDYSVAEGGPWLAPALEAMRELHDWSKPTFASCWGFQAMAGALGGEVVTDPRRAEVGTVTVHLSPEGKGDPVFGPLGDSFVAPMGHQDTVHRLPDGAVRLASSDLVENQAFCFPGKPIYCTQFHPELHLDTLLDRLRIYPKYVERIAGMPFEKFVQQCADTTDLSGVLARFVEQLET